MATQTQQKNLPSVNYLRGFLESDGSFQIHISNGDFKPLVKLTQMHKSTLDVFEEFLKSKGITSFQEARDTSSPAGRAGNLIVSGKNNVAKLLHLLESENTDSFLFAAVKQRDFLIMKAYTSMSVNSEKSTAVALGLKKSLHKETLNDPDNDVGGAKSTAQWEESLGLPPGATAKNQEKLMEIDEAYATHVKTLKESISNGSLVVNENYISGLIDGDGHYHVEFKFEPVNRSKGYYSKTIIWVGTFLQTMEAEAKLAMEVLLYYLKCEPTIHEVRSTKGQNKGRITSIKVFVRKQEDVRKLIDLHEKFPLIGEYKNAEFQTVKELFHLRDTNQLKNFETVKKFLAEIYRVSEISPRGRKRSLSLAEAIEKAREWLT